MYLLLSSGRYLLIMGESDDAKAALAQNLLNSKTANTLGQGVRFIANSVWNRLVR